MPPQHTPQSLLLQWHIHMHIHYPGWALPPLHSKHAPQRATETDSSLLRGDGGVLHQHEDAAAVAARDAGVLVQVGREQPRLRLLALDGEVEVRRLLDEVLQLVGEAGEVRLQGPDGVLQGAQVERLAHEAEGGGDLQAVGDGGRRDSPLCELHLQPLRGAHLHGSLRGDGCRGKWHSDLNLVGDGLRGAVDGLRDVADGDER
mmetsp:Transcript_23562/g.61207  ORF Transcript_23562/g.61207 Transcript_23562/m.61207 type:complete len:203 (-) Transcript_23562:568-1176(-)